MSGTSCCGPGYASPAEAIKAPSEKLLYTIAIYTGTGIQNEEAKKIAENAKIQYVSNKCIKQEYQKLFQKANPVFPVLKN